MKKVGIMTMHRVLNYGSFLQAYGLGKIIKDLKNDVEYIDFKFEGELPGLSVKKSFIKKILDHVNVIYYIKYKLHTKKFSSEYKEYLKMLDVSDYNYNHKIDTLVIGSDEVFNCTQPYPIGYSRDFFGNGFDNTNVLSYAGSFGHTTYEKLCNYNIENEIGSFFKKFKSISVRDDNSFEIVKKLTGKKPLLHFDPVLVSDFDEEIKNSGDVLYNNYIIIYAYPNRLKKDEKKYIRKFAKLHNKKIISLGFYQDIADYNLVVNPFLALKYIKNADYVITDTFHGTVFSIKMNTKFCTIIRDSNYNKLTSLLKKLHHEKQMVMDLDDIEQIYMKKIFFDKSNDVIKSETKKSIDYLSRNI